jgi:hypothetical protein
MHTGSGLPISYARDRKGEQGWRARSSRQMRGVTALICWSASLTLSNLSGDQPADVPWRRAEGPPSHWLVSWLLPPFLPSFPGASYIVS